MPGHCCVPHCNANYPSGPRVSVFSFPKDEEVLKKWLAVVPKKNLVPTHSTKVCQKHFKPEDIVKETSAFDSKKQVTITVTLKNHRLKPDAVPSIFEDIPTKSPKKAKNTSLKDNQEKDNIESSVGSSMHSKNLKSPLSSVPETGVRNNTCRQDGEKKGSVKSPKKASTTTDRPIIAVIKAEDLIMEEDKSPEKVEDDEEEEDDDDCIMEEQSPDASSFSLPSPFKNLPNVSVCLKEEDRVPITRELKGVKRSPSTGSNSSTGSSEAQKLNASMTKRRKVEKPAPVVIGRQNDCYCWVCHRENITLCCIACPRAYHLKCAGELSAVTTDWVCPECQKILAAENVDTRSTTLAEISLDKLGALLKLSLNKMKQRAPIAFHQPVSLEHYPLYLHYVIHPMDFSLLEKNIKQKVYGCTEAFLADVKWISHNSCVFNGTQHPLSTNAKNLVKSCDQDMQEIEVCPDCFVHSVVRNKYWFSEVCRKPHPLVWAKLKGFPYWPAKVVRIVDGNVDARFFGAHDRAWVPVSQCYHLSKEMPTTSKPKKKGNYEVALDELNVHVHLLIQKFGSFEYAPYRTSFNPLNKFLMYHGIDIDKVSKEEISFDTSSPVSEKFHSSEKENRFASFMESDREKLSPDEAKLSENQLEKHTKGPLESNVGIKSSFLSTERKSADSVLSNKETDEDEANHEKSTLEDKTNTQTRTVDEKRVDSSQVLPVKISEKVSASDQFRKLELALERIKGYVSLTAESEKESGESINESKEENKSEEGKNASEEVKKDNTGITTSSSSLFKDSITLPVIETDSVQESNIDVAKSLETTRKTDSFFLKLNATIESCKAKLGISEVNDDLSDESGADENASRSDEDEEDNSSASEAEEEVSDEEVDDEEDDDDDEEDEEVVQISDEELENGEDENELEDKDEESAEDVNSESEEESNSESSGTDIESHVNDASPKKSGKTSGFENEVNGVTSCDKDAHFTNEDSCKVVNDSVKETDAVDIEASITNPDLQVPEVTVNDSGASEIVGENTSSELLAESSNDMKEVSSNAPFNLAKNDQTLNQKASGISNSVLSVQHNSEVMTSKEDSSSIIIEDSIDRSGAYVSSVSSPSNDKSVENPEKVSDSVRTLNGSVLSQNNTPEKHDVQSDVEMKSMDTKISGDISSVQCKNEPVDEDDEIYICTPTRPKSPPVIVLDDDGENEDSSVSDTFAVKSPPYSTSAESFSNEENPACRTNSGDERGDSSPSKPVIVNGRASGEGLLGDNTVEMNGVSDSLQSNERRKRKLSSDDSSDDEIQIVSPVKRANLTGAKRTFNKTSNVETTRRVSPTLESVKRNLAKEGLEKANKSTLPAKVPEIETESLRSEPTSPFQSPQQIMRTAVIDTSNLSDQEKEILFLKRKLTCLMTAYKIQGWKCNQEREELRHNMNLIIMEMRACLESDKKQAIDALARHLEQEKQKSVEEAKRKQWCASCLTESRYSCCWNTSYCSVECQKRHFPEHRNSCSQIKNKNIEILEVKSNAAPSVCTENNENKRVIIVNMKPDAGKVSIDKPVSVLTPQTSVSKPEIQILATKSTLQTPPSTSSAPVQFVLAPVKPSGEPNVTTSAPPSLSFMEKELDSAQIISHVRNKACDLGTAISLLKKKNLESTLSVLVKKKEQKQKEETPKEDANLEEVYFPPPKVTFEGYDAASPEPNLAVNDDEEAKIDCDTEAESSEIQRNLSPEQDVVLSDNDDMGNEMVNIGHSVEVKAKFLNKCLVYGQTAKKLTRCLVDVIFPDLKLLATCSAFGQKSNVTKLTRAALPARKVYAIIDYVTKRFPFTTRSEIVLAINMKCKEARIMLHKRESDSLKKTAARRLLAKEQEDEQALTVTAAPVIVTTSCPTIISPIISPKGSPNVVCVKSSTQIQPLPFNLPKKQVSIPNILRCNSQLVVSPKPVLTPVGNAAVLQTAPQPKKRETVKELLSKNKNLSSGNVAKDGPQIVMAVDAHKQSATNTQSANATSSSATNTQSANATSSSATNMRPYIIIGSQANAAKQSTSSVQNTTLPVSSDTASK